jgi:hypothetical protein
MQAKLRRKQGCFGSMPPYSAHFAQNDDFAEVAGRLRHDPTVVSLLL